MKPLLIALVLVGFCADAVAAPVKVPPMKLCADGTGGVLAKKKCAKTETQLTLEALKGADGTNGTNGAAGATGATGPQGAPGLFGFDGCHWVTELVASSFMEWVTLQCAEGEFLFSHGIALDSGASFVIENITLYRLDAEPRQPYAVEYQINNTAGDSYIARGQAYCCPIQ